MNKVKKFYDTLSKLRICNKEGDIIISANLREELVDYFHNLVKEQESEEDGPVGSDAYFKRLYREGKFKYSEEI